MLAIRSRVHPHVDGDRSVHEREENSTANIGDVKTTRLERWSAALPTWALLPLAGVLTASVLLACMLPVYFTFKKTSDQQDTAIVWPFGTSRQQLYDIEDIVTLEIDLLSIDPKMREITVLVEVHLGERFEHDDHEGLIELPDGYYILLSLGSQTIKIQSGDAIADASYTFIMDDELPLFQYPFDRYKVHMPIRAALINSQDTSNILEEILNVGLVMFAGSQGWQSETVLSPYVKKDGTIQQGVVVDMTMTRSVSVQFFSLFIVILMWFISLSMFAISINFVMSDSLEIAYDVPALAVGFLFALPFVRDVQPDVPTVGATIDVMGFFFNMLLISVSTVLAMAALSSRYHHSNRLKLQQLVEQRLETMMGKQSTLNSTAATDPEVGAPGTSYAGRTSPTVVKHGLRDKSPAHLDTTARNDESNQSSTDLIPTAVNQGPM